MAEKKPPSPPRGSPKSHHRASSPLGKNTTAGGIGDRPETAKVKKNSKGGLYVSSEELHAAFTLLDADKNGIITLQNLKKRLGVFFPNMTAKEYRFLMNNRKEITFEDLEELLVDNEVTNFDPAIDAFRAFDPDGTGAISADKLREVFSALNFGELTDEELDILTRVSCHFIILYTIVCMCNLDSHACASNCAELTIAYDRNIIIIFTLFCIIFQMLIGC